MMADQPKPTCAVIHPGETYIGKQAFTYFAGVSAENCGAQGICMHLLTIPPGGRAKAHLHENHETAIYVISGEAGMWYGANLAEHLVCKAGDYVYIPAGVPHLPYNPSDSQACTAVLARTDPNEQESVVLLPELDDVH
ncbi:MAG: hypothetical protein FOGNACKC_02610 [Anaerolineae bacterium]|nr:hypothetical protein [Anaerolineae bacterium]